MQIIIFYYIYLRHYLITDKLMRFFLTGTLTMITCFILQTANAEKGLIFYGDANVAGKENVFVNPDSSSSSYVTKPAKITKKKEAPVASHKDINARRQISTTVIPVFPFTPASPAYLTATEESATIAQQRTHLYSQPGKTTCREKTYSHIKDSDFSTYHHPKQRHKLSIAAIQCGELTSFGSNYPPGFLK